jgi:hypothetical protein
LIDLYNIYRSKKKVLPGIEPGLPEDTEVIRIRSDNRYLGGVSHLLWIELIRG